MPTDPSTDPATATTRRSFLTRTAVGGALVTAGAMAFPLSSLLPHAGAQDEPFGDMSDAQFAAFATPLELAAVQAYQAALDTGLLDASWTGWGRLFQKHHQTAADTIATLASADATTPVPNPELLEATTTAIEAATDRFGVLLALATLEDTISATHLESISAVVDPITARSIAQIMTVEDQQAALLAVGGNTPIDEVTPATATTEGAIEFTEPDAAETTTTAAN